MVGKIVVIGDDSEEFHCLNEQLLTLGQNKANIHHFNLQDLKNNFSSDLDVDLIFLLLPSPHKDCIKTFEYVKEKFHKKPIIVLSSEEDSNCGLIIIGKGAQDYLVKGQYNHFLLNKSMHYAIERNSMVKQLAIAKADYEDLFLNHPNPMWIFDNDSQHLLAVNNAAIKNYGYSREEFLKLKIKDIRHKDENEQLHNILNSLEENSDVLDAGIWRHRKKSGEEFFVHIFFQRTKFEGRQARMAVAIDVNDNVVNSGKNKQLRLEVETYAERINNILESITDGFFAVDKEWKLTYVNTVFEKTFASKRDILLGKLVWDVLPPLFGSTIAHRYEKAMRSKKPFNFEEHFKELDKWFSVSVYPSQDGMSVYIQDITKSRKMKEKILNDQINLNALINNTDDLIWSLDKEFNVLTANDAVKTAMKQFLKDGIQEGKSILSEDAAPELKNTWESLYTKALNGKAYNIEQKVDMPDGSCMYLDVSFNPIKNSEKEVIGIGCYARDVTERKKHQLVIEHHNRLLEDIAWKQSHKMRGPVASILGIIQIFDFNDMDSPFNAQLLQHLKSTTKKLDNMIRDIVKSTVALDQENFNENGEA